MDVLFQVIELIPDENQKKRRVFAENTALFVSL